MSLQTTVNYEQPIGVEGEIHQDTPHKVDARSGIAEGSLLGKAYTLDATTGIPVQGGSGVYYGIAGFPKEQANYAGNLAATLAVGAGATVGFIKMGRVTVKVAVAVAYGDSVYFTSDGSLTNASSGNTAIPNAKFIVAADAGELTVIDLAN